MCGGQRPEFSRRELSRCTPPPPPVRDPVPPPPVVTKDGEEEYEVEEILDSRIRRRRLEYYVKWHGYGAEENSWQPKAHLANAPELIADFHRLHPNAPGP